MKLFDTHCHLAGIEMLPQALQYATHAFENGVDGLALISADEASLSGVQSLTQSLKSKFPDKEIVYTAGIHPHDSSTVGNDLWQKIEASASKGASAIGETGLDFFYNHSDRHSQIELFEKHIDLAIRVRKPLVIHCRQAKDEVLNSLKIMKGRANPGILHCFTEDLSCAKTLAEWGFFISFSGILTFKNANELREVAKWVPPQQLLIETDSPWLAPVPMRGKPNEPLFVRYVFDQVLSLRQSDGFSEESLFASSLG